MKVLFFMSHGVFARNFEWALREFAARGHHVHVALDHMEKDGVPRINEILDACSRKLPGLTYGPAPARPPADVGRGFRLLLDYVRYLDPAYADAVKARARMASRIPRSLRVIAQPLLALAAGRALVRSMLRLAAAGVPVPPELRQFVADLAPDVILVTPLVDPGSPQDDYVRCARELGVPNMLAVHSWDNLTLKGGVHTVPDRIAVWNEAQRREAGELHAIPGERIVVTGAVAYDHWFEWTPSTDRLDFCSTVGLDPARPYVLYLGSSRFIAPEESTFVHEWITEVRTAEPALRDLQVLVRPHPLNLFEASGLSDVAVRQPTEAEPLDNRSRCEYFDSIYHSAVVVGVLTSGLVEAAIVGRPVHVLLTERYRDSQDGLLHFRHLLPENGGMLHVAHNYREHATQLRASIAEEDVRHNTSFVETFVRPFGLDEPASPRLVDAAETLASAPVSASMQPHAPVGARALAGAGRVAHRVLRPLYRLARSGAVPHVRSARSTDGESGTGRRDGLRSNPPHDRECQKNLHSDLTEFQEHLLDYPQQFEDLRS